MRRIASLMAAVFLLAGFGYGQSSGRAPAEKSPKTTYIVAGRLFDATGETVRQNVVIVVEDERIKSVVSNSGSAIPAGATVIDLSHSTVLPGLIDCHTHLAGRADRYNEIYRFRTTPFDYAFNAVVNARKTLEAGFTSVRDVGSPPFLAVDLRNSINEGFIPGPRVVASGPAISIYWRARRSEQFLSRDAGDDVSRRAQFSNR